MYRSVSLPSNSSFVASCHADLYCERPTSATDCGGCYTSSGKSLGMHTLSPPLCSTAGLPAIKATSSSVVHDARCRVLPSFVHRSYATASSAPVPSSFTHTLSTCIFTCFQELLREKNFGIQVVASEDQDADVFMKPLAATPFIYVSP